MKIKALIVLEKQHILKHAFKDWFKIKPTWFWISPITLGDLQTADWRLQNSYFARFESFVVPEISDVACPSCLNLYENCNLIDKQFCTDLRYSRQLENLCNKHCGHCDDRNWFQIWKLYFRFYHVRVSCKPCQVIFWCWKIPILSK